MNILNHIQVEGVTKGFTELRLPTNDVSLNYVVGPDNGLPL